MKRIKVLIGKRRVMVIATLAILVLAAAALVASSASFTATSANPDNTFTTGNLHHINGNNNAAILTASLMKPGDDATGTVMITNDGTLDGTFTLTQSSVVNGAGTPSFASYLELTITDTTVGSTWSWTGSLNGIPAAGIALPNITAGNARTFRFDVHFPNGAAGADNQYRGTTASCQFDWTQNQ